MAAPRLLCSHGRPRSQFPARISSRRLEGDESLRLRRQHRRQTKTARTKARPIAQAHYANHTGPRTIRICWRIKE
jgi:hypothetical protein